jgi:DNA-directed RNA polymerase I, II, and III subunit RPABC2
MSSGVPTVPTLPKIQLREGRETDDEEEDPVVVQDDGSESEIGDAGSIQSDDDGSSAAADTSDEGDNETSDEEEVYEEGEGDGAAGGGVGAAGGGVASGGNHDSDDEGGQSNTKKTNKKKRPTNKKNIEDDMTLLGIPHGIHFDDDEDEDEDEDAVKDSSEYFQKLKSSVRESYVDTYHPESMSHNYDEIQTLARVVRNSAGVIVDDLHRTIPIMTKYEKTRILGQRAKQINEASPTFIKIDSSVIDGYLIAVKELEQKKTPFIIRRPLPNGGSEYWRVQDLEIL